MKLTNEHKESIITEHWLHKERTESTNKQVLPKKQVKGQHMQEWIHETYLEAARDSNDSASSPRNTRP